MSIRLQNEQRSLHLALIPLLAAIFTGGDDVAAIAEPQRVSDTTERAVDSADDVYLPSEFILFEMGVKNKEIRQQLMLPPDKGNLRHPDSLSRRHCRELMLDPNLILENYFGSYTVQSVQRRHPENHLDEKILKPIQERVGQTIFIGKSRFSYERNSWDNPIYEVVRLPYRPPAEVEGHVNPFRFSRSFNELSGDDEWYVDFLAVYVRRGPDDHRPPRLVGSFELVHGDQIWDLANSVNGIYLRADSDKQDGA